MGCNRAIKSTEDTYPVKALEEYIAATKIDLSEELPFFLELSRLQDPLIQSLASRLELQQSLGDRKGCF